MGLKLFIILGFLIILSIAFIAMRKDRFRGGSGALGNAMQEMHAAFDPGVRHAIVEKKKEQVEEDDSGDPPS